MTWVYTEDNMPLHPKILRLSDGAFRLWQNALHFANRATTDGKIEKSLLPSLNHHGRWTTKQMAGFVAELVGSLWTDEGDCYRIHNYEVRQAEAMSARVNRRREIERLKKQGQRERREREELARLSGVPALSPGGQTQGQTGDKQVDIPREISVHSIPVHSPSLRSGSLSADTRLLVRQHFARWYEQSKATLWPPNQAKSDDVRAVADWVDQMAARENIAPEAVLERVLRHFAADDFTQNAGSPWAHFAKNYANYWQAPKPKVANTNGRVGRILT